MKTMPRILRRWIGKLVTVGVLGAGMGVGMQLAGDLAPRRGEREARPAALTGSAQASPPPAAASPNNPRRTIVVDVAQRVSPAVVSIGATKTTYLRESDPFGFDLYFPLYQYAKREFPYLGSGFIIDRQGHVLTNYHVVQGATSISVTLTDRRGYTAKLLDADTYVDVALLKIEGLGDEALPTLPLGNSDDIMIGETMLAIGNPFGPLLSDPRPSVSVGVVSAVDRSFKLTRDDKTGGEHTYRNMIQTDAAINPGNSGGPLVNLDGEAIGINTFIFSNSGDSASVGFSIPINRARKIAAEILKFGRVRPIWMDIEPLNLTPAIRQWLQLAVDKGALIKSIEIGGPAERAGLTPGDVVTACDGAPINDAGDLLAHIVSRNVGDKIHMRVARKDRTLELIYPVTEAPRGKNVPTNPI
jgi:serine protease Do